MAAGRLPSTRVDLHIHTTASDGRWSPDSLLPEIEARSIGLFAIADHDTIGHVAATETLAREAGVAYLRGVEISSRLNGQLFHILAYGFDPASPELNSLLDSNVAAWDAYNEMVIRSLIDGGYPISLDDYHAYAHDRTRGGWKPLRFVMDRGFCSGIADYFDNLVPDLPMCLAEFAHPADAISAIREAAGVPILAHPGAWLDPAGNGDATLGLMRDLGIAGLECYSQYHDRAETRYYLDWCTRNSMLVTGGSDSHGGFVGRELGVPVVEAADLILGELWERIEC